MIVVSRVHMHRITSIYLYVVGHRDNSPLTVQSAQLIKLIDELIS